MNFFSRTFGEIFLHVTCDQSERERGHIGVIPHHHTIMGTMGEGQGRWGRRMEVGGGDFGGGRGELAPKFPLSFLGFSPLHLPFLDFSPGKGKKERKKEEKKKKNELRNYACKEVRSMRGW